MKTLAKGLFLVFLCVLAASSFAMSFEEVDFERLVLNHPMMKNYDPQTGYFKNTDYVFHDINQLKQEIQDLATQYSVLNRAKTDLASKSVKIDEEADEESFWSNTSNYSEQQKELAAKILEKNYLVTQAGMPDVKHLFNITSQMASDTILPLYNKDKILINKLPDYPSYKPDINNDFTSRKFIVNNNYNFIKEYLEKAKAFYSIFPNTDRTILYNSNNININTDKIGTIDLCNSFLLHPKMAFFDFSNFGFFKYKPSISSEKKEKAIEIIKENASNPDEEIKKLQKELNDLSNKKYAYYREKLSNYQLDEEAKAKIKEMSDEEDELQKAIFDLKYSANLPELTTPQETLKIIEDIWEDIFSEIDKIKEEQGLQLIINNSFISPPPYEMRYISFNLRGYGYAGLNHNLFYSFYNKNNLTTPFDKTDLDLDTKRWLDLTQNKNKHKYILAMNPYPLVITGGKSILANVVKNIYKKYNIDSSASIVLDSVITKVEAYQNGINY